MNTPSSHTLHINTSHASLAIASSLYPLPMANVFRSTGSVLGVMDDMARTPMNRVPQKYIRPDREPLLQSHQATPVPTIPIVDFKSFLVCGKARDAQLHNLHSTCKDWGFFQVC